MQFCRIGYSAASDVRAYAAMTRMTRGRRLPVAAAISTALVMTGCLARTDFDSVATGTLGGDPGTTQGQDGVSGDADTGDVAPLPCALDAAWLTTTGLVAHWKLDTSPADETTKPTGTRLTRYFLESVGASLPSWQIVWRRRSVPGKLRQ